MTRVAVVVVVAAAAVVVSTTIYQEATPTSHCNYRTTSAFFSSSLRPLVICLGSFGIPSISSASISCACSYDR